MLSYLKKILMPEDRLENKYSASANANQAERKIQIATCILFVELANADSRFSTEELGKIISIMKKTFSLDEEEVKELIELAQERIRIDDSTYEYTTVISRNFSNPEKYELLKNLWHLVFIDKSMDKYEEHMVKKIGMLINVDYRDIISARLLVKQELKI
ncbi:MAG: TerB family tellurite resistance protein [Ignavibacteria bacterium]